MKGCHARSELTMGSSYAESNDSGIYVNMCESDMTEVNPFLACPMKKLCSLHDLQGSSQREKMEGYLSLPRHEHGIGNSGAC
jgi:hypothetical protein